MVEFGNPLIRGDICLWGLWFLHDFRTCRGDEGSDVQKEGGCFQLPGLTNKVGALLTVTCLTACGEPAFENAGSQASLLEDREVCAVEVNNSPAANAYRQNPDAHPDYPAEVFNEMNRCIERKGWKQVRSEQEQEQLRDAIVKEAMQQAPPGSISDSKAKDSMVRAVEQRFSLRSKVKSD